MKLREKVVHGLKWTAIQQYIEQLFDVAIFVILARLLGPQDFGLVAMAAALIAMLGPLMAQGLGPAIIQRAEIETAHLNSAFWPILALGTLFMVFFISTAEWWATVFSEPKLAGVLRWLSLGFVLSSLVPVQAAILRRNLRIKSLSLRSMLAELVGGLVGLALALNDFGVWSLVARMLAARTVGVFLLWAVSDWRPQFQFSFSHFKDLFSFGVHMMASGILVGINRRSDSLLIGYFLGSTALGFYNIAYRLMSIVFKLVSKSVTQVGMPAFARIQNDPDRLKSAFYETSQMVAFVAVPAFLGIMLLVPEIVGVLLGEKWVPSIPVLQVLVLIGIAHCLLEPMISVIVGTGRSGLRLKLQAVDSVANVIGFLIAVHWGIVAVAMSYVTVGYLMVPLWYLALKSSVPVLGSEYLRAIVGPFVATLVMMLAISADRLMFVDVLGGTAFLVLAVATGILIYASTIYLLYPAIAKKIFDIAKMIFARKAKMSAS